jgi:anti-sigma factor RsiW
MWGRKRADDVPPPNRNVDHWDRLINAYVDDMLTPAQRLEVEEFLSLHPEVARRVNDYRNQNRGLHDLYDHYLSEPLPEGAQILEQHIMRKLSRRSVFNAYGRAAAAAAIVILAVAGGWAGAQYYLGAPIGAPAPLLVAGTGGATPAPAAPTAVAAPTESAQPAKVAASSPAGIAGARAAGIPAPDLRAHGFQLTGSREIVKADGAAAARLIYESKDGSQVTLYVAPIDDVGTRKISLSRRGPIWFLLWNNKGRAYSMIGEIGRDTMLAIGATINARLSEPVPPGMANPAPAPVPVPGAGQARPTDGKTPDLNEKTLIRPAVSQGQGEPEKETR